MAALWYSRIFEVVFHGFLTSSKMAALRVTNSPGKSPQPAIGLLRDNYDERSCCLAAIDAQQFIERPSRYWLPGG